MEYQIVMNRLLSKIPEFKTRYDSVLEENDGEILGTIVFSELARFYIETFRDKKEELVNRIQKLMEELLREDESSRILVVTGFLEDLAQAGEDYEKVKTSLRPSLVAELREVDKAWRKLKP